MKKEGFFNPFFYLLIAVAQNDLIKKQLSRVLD
jgi:hypothetical protein